MNRSTKIIIGVVPAVLVALLGFSIWQHNRPASPSASSATVKEYSRDVVKETFAKINYDEFDFNSIIAANAANGNLPDNIKGSADAPVKIFEYADYQCSYCAAMNSYLNRIVEEYQGKVAVVFRAYILPYHKNATAATSAADAAAIQGFWPEYKNYLFMNQNDWFYSTGETLQQQFEQYFDEATNGKGDLEKFRADMQSDAVAQKVAFDMGIGDKLGIGGTPWFYIDGEWIENDGLAPAAYAQKLRNVIDEKLAKNKS